MKSYICDCLSKGHQVNIPELGGGIFYGDVSELGDASRDPGKSFLFFLTEFEHEIDLVGAMVIFQAEQFLLRLSGAFLTAHENPREIFDSRA